MLGSRGGLTTRTNPAVAPHHSVGSNRTQEYRAAVRPDQVSRPGPAIPKSRGERSADGRTTMVSPMRRDRRWSMMVLAGALAAGIVPGPSAFAGGGHGGGHRGGGFDGGGHRGGSPYFSGYPYHRYGHGYGYGPYVSPGWTAYSGYPGFIGSTAASTVWTPWSWMASSGYPAPMVVPGSGTGYGFPLRRLRIWVPVARSRPRSEGLGKDPSPYCHRGLRCVGAAPAVIPARDQRSRPGIEAQPVIDAGSRGIAGPPPRPVPIGRAPIRIGSPGPIRAKEPQPAAYFQRASSRLSQA
jgi:hypothetical protein